MSTETACTPSERALVEATLRLWAARDKAAAIWAERRQCEALTWREVDDEEIAPGWAVNVGRIHDGNYCSRHAYEDPQDGTIVTPHQCAACKHNEDVILRWHAARRSLGGLTRNVARLARKVAAERAEIPAWCTRCGRPVPECGCPPDGCTDPPEDVDLAEWLRPGGESDDA